MVSPSSFAAPSCSRAPQHHHATFRIGHGAISFPKTSREPASCRFKFPVGRLSDVNRFGSDRLIRRSWSLDRLEAGDALGLEDLHGVGLELVVAGEAFVQADDPLRFLAPPWPGSIPASGRSRQMKSAPPATLWTALARQGQRLHRRGEREAALEQNFVEQIVRRAPLADVVHVHSSCCSSAGASVAPRRSRA